MLLLCIIFGYFVSTLGSNGNIFCQVCGNPELTILIISGDIAFRFLEYVKNSSPSGTETSSRFDIDLPEFPLDVAETPLAEEADDGTAHVMSHVTVCDINQAMLDVGKERAKRLGHREGQLFFLFC